MLVHHVWRSRLTATDLILPQKEGLAAWSLVCFISNSVFCLPGCASPLGLENRMIFSRQLSASSERDSRHGAKHGRLHGNTAWCSARSSLPKYFQVYIPLFLIICTYLSSTTSFLSFSLVVFVLLLFFLFSFYHKNDSIRRLILVIRQKWPLLLLKGIRENTNGSWDTYWNSH